MNKDTRLSGVLHVLVHLGQVSVPLTSEVLAKSMGTNAPVFRRTMAGLRKTGYVQSEKGHGGGWALAKPLDEITLLDVYVALGKPGLFAIASRNEDSACKIEQAVNAAMSETLAKAEAMIVQQLGSITLASLVPDRPAGTSIHGQPVSAA